MKNNTKNIIFLLVTIIFPIILIFGFSISNNKLIDNSWKNKTYELIKNSQEEDGGVNNFVPERDFSLYTTYYNLLINQELDNNYINKSNLKTQVENIKFNLDEIKGFNGLRSLFFLTELKMKSNSNSNDSEQYIAYIQKHQLEDGLFYYENETDLVSVINNTRLSIEILKNANKDYIHIKDTLIEQLYVDALALNDPFKPSIIKEILNIEFLLNNQSVLETNQELRMNILKLNNNYFNTQASSPEELLNALDLYEIFSKINEAPLISKDFLNSLNQYKIKDGYNFFDNRYPDSQLTYKILLLTKDKKTAKNFLNYFRKFQVDEGGYVYNNPNKSNILSSYWALKTIKNLKKEPNEKLISFFENSLNNLDKFSPIETYYLIKSSKMLNLEIKEFSIKLPDRIESVDDIYLVQNYIFLFENVPTKYKDEYSDDLIKLLNSRIEDKKFTNLGLIADCLIKINPKVNKDKIIQFENPTSLIKNIGDVYNLLSLFETLDLEIDKNKLSIILKDFLHMDGGIMFEKNSEIGIDLEATYCGLEAITILEEI